MAANMLSTNILVAYISSYFDVFNAPWRFDISLFIIIFVALSFAEFSFTTAHYWLHQTKSGAKYHMLHHLCMSASWSTNLLFHPFDLAAEFSGPILGVVFITMGIFNDPFALLVSLHILHLWYALDHSENLRLYHYKHHKYIDSVYSIYMNFRLKSPTDHVRELIHNKGGIKES